MWAQAVCSATYIDSKGAEQSIELTHWLSEVPKNIQNMIIAQKEKEFELMAMYGIDKFGEPVQPDDFPPPDTAIEPESETLEQDYASDFCERYGLPPDCESWPFDKLFQALLDLRK
jgi:hypothetical protein